MDRKSSPIPNGSYDQPESKKTLQIMTQRSPERRRLPKHALSSSERFVGGASVPSHDFQTGPRNARAISAEHSHWVRAVLISQRSRFRAGPQSAAVVLLPPMLMVGGPQQACHPQDRNRCNQKLEHRARAAARPKQRSARPRLERVFLGSLWAVA